MVLAGGCAAYISRPASTCPVSISAMIHAGAGPSGIGIEPGGWSVSAVAVPAVAVSSISAVVALARSLRMVTEPNPRP